MKEIKVRTHKAMCCGYHKMKVVDYDLALIKNLKTNEVFKIKPRYRLHLSPINSYVFFNQADNTHYYLINKMKGITYA